MEVEKKYWFYIYFSSPGVIFFINLINILIHIYLIIFIAEGSTLHNPPILEHLVTAETAETVRYSEPNWQSFSEPKQKLKIFCQLDIVWPVSCVMPRKRKRVTKKNKISKRLSARDQKIAKLIVNSYWRVDTADNETTAGGKEVYSGWQRCIILDRLDANEDYPEGAVKVRYLDDEAGDELFTYGISEFIQVSDPAPCHVVDLTGQVQTSVAHEQPKFEMQERGELIPLQKRKVCDPKKWKKNSRKFDNTWGGTFNLHDQHKHVVPQCDLPKCELDCEKLNHDAVLYSRNQLQKFVERGVNEKISWLSLLVRPVTIRIPDSLIWNNFVKKNVQDGRASWSCTFCKCNPNEPSAAAIADPKHKFKGVKKRKDSKYAACPDFSIGVMYKKRIVHEVRTTPKQHTYHVPVSDVGGCRDNGAPTCVAKKF